jgi:hypothetical protein
MRRQAALIAGLVAGAALSLFRQRGAGALDTLWAEDGTIFLEAALRDPSPAAWLSAYAGYMHAAPRVLASLAAVLPIGWASEALSAGAAAATAGVAAVTYRAAGEHIPSGWVRLLLALAVVLLPPGGIEGANAAANIHWYLLYAGVWVSLWRPAAPLEQGVGSAVLLLTAASDPFAVLFGPVLGLRLLSRPRQASDWAFAAALGVGLALQAGVVLANSGTRELDPSSAGLAELGRWYGFRVLETAAFGAVLRDRLNDALGIAPTALLALGLLGVLLAPAVRAARAEPRIPLLLGALHLGLYFLPVILSGMSPPRYTLAPILALYGLIAWGLAHAPRALGALAIGLFAVVAALDFAPPNRRADGPSWSAELAAAAPACAGGAASAAEVTIPPLPTPQPDDPARSSAHWSVAIPCEKLAPGSGR